MSSNTDLSIKLLACQVAVGIGDQIAVLRSNVRAQQVVNEGMRLGDVTGVFWNGEIVKEHLRAFLRDRIADFNSVLGLDRTLLRLLDVARPADDQTDFPAGQCVQIFRRMEFSHRRPDFHQQVGGLVQFACVSRIRIEAEIMECCRHDVVSGIKHLHAAILELGEILRFEHNIPAVDLAIRAEPLAHAL